MKTEDIPIVIMVASHDRYGCIIEYGEQKRFVEELLTYHILYEYHASKVHLITSIRTCKIGCDRLRYLMANV